MRLLNSGFSELTPDDLYDKGVFVVAQFTGNSNYSTITPILAAGASIASTRWMKARSSSWRVAASTDIGQRRMRLALRNVNFSGRAEACVVGEESSCLEQCVSLRLIRLTRLP